jgi:hypothetical protein
MRLQGVWFKTISSSALYLFNIKIMAHPNSPDKSTTAYPSKLLDQVRDKLRAKHSSIHI